MIPARMRHAESRPCWWCRALFVTRYRDVVYCSPECGDAHKAEIPSVVRASYANRAGTMLYQLKRRVALRGAA